jgi:tRNA G18 (ribose-2'-O)-methylase SpoU
MGAQFMLPVVTDVTIDDLRASFAALAARGGSVPEVLIADPHEGEDARTLVLEAGALVVLGAEREGPGSGWQDARRVTIPQSRFESLNVAMAGTILAYEFCPLARQGRSGK